VRPVSWHFKCMRPKDVFRCGEKEERSPPRISRCLKSRDAIVLDYYYTKGRRDNNTRPKGAAQHLLRIVSAIGRARAHLKNHTQIRRLSLKYISRRVPLWRFMVAFVASTSKNTSRPKFMSRRLVLESLATEFTSRGIASAAKLYK
jgi:hypothetical protein